jgi:hypothetical protein
VSIPPSPLHLLVLYSAVFVVLVLWKRRALFAIFGSAGRPAAYFASIAMVVLVICQAFPPGRTAYPVAAWDMYTLPRPPAQAYAIKVVRASGEIEQLSMSRVLRGPDPRPMMWHLYSGAQRLDRGSPDLVDVQKREIEAYLEALVTLDARRRSADRIVRVEIQGCTLDPVATWQVHCDRTIADWKYDGP